MKTPEEELRALSIPELLQYIDALLDLPRPANDEARANWRRALHALRDKYDEEHAAALGVSVADFREFDEALQAWWWSTQTRQ